MLLLLDLDKFDRRREKSVGRGERRKFIFCSFGGEEEGRKGT